MIKIIVITLMIIFGNVQARQIPLERNEPSTRGLIETVQNLILQLNNTIFKLAQDLQITIDTLIKDVLEQLQSIENDANQLLEAIQEDIQNDIDKINQTTGCLEGKQQEIEEAISKGNSEINTCINDASTKIYEIQNKIDPYVQSIKDYLRNTSGLIAECTHTTNPLEIINCVIDNVKEVKDNAIAIYKDGINAIKLAASEMSNIVEQSRNCVNGAVKNVETDLHKIVNEIKTCVASTSTTAAATVRVVNRRLI